jgi:YidC/Oxa1 family membrane protein insertase
MWDSLLRGLGQVLAFLYDVVPNYGVAIILFTILTRIVLLPVVIKQIRTQKEMQEMSSKMQALQPELQKIKLKYKGDKQKIYEETNRLYQEHGLNPMASLMGCLPLLLQMPFMFALFRLLNVCAVGAKNCVSGTKYLPAASGLFAAIAAGNTYFLGIDLLKSPNNALKDLGVIGALPYFLLLALMTAGSLISTRQMQRNQAPPPANPTPQQQQMQSMQKMMRFFPLMFAVFGLSFPAGLSLYWTTSQLWQVAQQYIMITRKREVPEGERKSVEKVPTESWLKRVLPTGISSMFRPSPNGKNEEAVGVEPPVEVPAVRNGGGRPRANRSKKKKRKKGRRR